MSVKAMTPKRIDADCSEAAKTRRPTGVDPAHAADGFEYAEIKS